MKTKWLALVLLFLLMGCTTKIDFEPVVAKMQFIAVYTNSNPDKDEWRGPIVYEPNSPQMQRFVKWLKESKGWKGDFQSYQIPTMMVESDDFALFFFGTYVNLILGNDLYSKKVDQADFDYLLSGSE